MDAAPMLGDLASGADPHPVAGGEVIEELDELIRPGRPVNRSCNASDISLGWSAPSSYITSKQSIM
jgi:hypothetical protein